MTSRVLGQVFSATINIVPVALCGRNVVAAQSEKDRLDFNMQLRHPLQKGKGKKNLLYF